MNETPQDLQPEEETPGGPPPLTAEQISQIVQGNVALQKALDQDPVAMTEIEAIIQEHTRKDITPATLQEIVEGLSFYLDTEGLDHLLAVFVRSDDARYVEQSEAHSAPQTWSWLRRLLALYGSDLREAHALSGENENGWREVNRRAYYDAVTGTWGVALEIIKFSGERVLLDGHPTSALTLAVGIVDTLNSVPPEVAPDIIDRATVENFVVQSTQLGNLYAPGMIDEWAEED